MALVNGFWMVKWRYRIELIILSPSIARMVSALLKILFSHHSLYYRRPQTNANPIRQKAQSRENLGGAHGNGSSQSIFNRMQERWLFRGNYWARRCARLWLWGTSLQLPSLFYFYSYRRKTATLDAAGTIITTTTATIILKAIVTQSAGTSYFILANSPLLTR